MRRAYKTELDLNNEQVTMCLQHAGAARFAYNWGLREIIQARARGEKKPTAIDLHKKLNALKATEFPWMYESSKCAPQEALRNLDVAFDNFFRRCKQGVKKKGFPKFKSRKAGIGSFRLTGTIRITDRTIQLPRLGELRLKEDDYLPADAEISSATVSEKNGRWYVSVLTEVEVAECVTPDMPIVGIDLGIKSLAVLSSGEVIENPKHLRAAQRKLKRLQRAVSRRKKGSGRRKDAVRRLGKQHERVANKRKDAINKFTTKVTRETSVIGIEDLSVRGMMANHHLAGALADASFGEIRRQIEYKAGWYGSTVVVIDRFAPTSKMCSGCGCIKDSLSLSERTFKCDACGLVIDRDLNAALNIKHLAASYADSLNGRGLGSTGDGRKSVVKLPKVKRQLNVKSDAGPICLSFG